MKGFTAAGAAGFPLLKEAVGPASAKRFAAAGAAGFPLFKEAVGSASAKRFAAGAAAASFPLLKKEEKVKKKKQKKTDAAGKFTLTAAGPGWEPSLPDPEQPPRVQRLPYRPDPARPPQVQLLQMQRSALPYVGWAGKNSGAANWVEKLDWKTPSGAPYTSAPEQGGPSNLVELIMAQRGGGGGGFSPGAGAGRGDAPAPGTGVGGGFAGGGGGLWAGDEHAEQSCCLLYTSDAADEL